MQPDLPSLPPMQPPAASAPLPPPSIPPAAGKSPPVAFGRRLRQMMTIVASGSLGLVVLLGVAEVAFKPGLRPTDIAATFEARTELGILNQKLGAKPGEVLLTEDQYRAKLAEAERSGQAKAELAYQKEVAVVQADKERVTGAYSTLYQRTNIIAQAGVQMESQALQFRQRLIEQTNGGRVIVLTVYDTACGFGSAEACEKAQQIRSGMIVESGALTEGDIARKVNELMAGIPDPASLVAGADVRANGTPTLPR